MPALPRCSPDTALKLASRISSRAIVADSHPWRQGLCSETRSTPLELTLPRLPSVLAGSRSEGVMKNNADEHHHTDVVIVQERREATGWLTIAGQPQVVSH